MVKKPENTDASTAITQLENESETMTEKRTEMLTEFVPVLASETRGESQTLESLPELAARHRIPGWQQAAVERLMNWTDGKKVYENEYLRALDRLSNRPLGGGRA